jgi:hypothetical protein
MVCQSAPPGSTVPLSDGPAKVPPVIGMIRRRPPRTAPTSCGVPTVARISKANVSFGGAAADCAMLEPAQTPASARHELTVNAVRIMVAPR